MGVKVEKSSTYRNTSSKQKSRNKTKKSGVKVENSSSDNDTASKQKSKKKAKKSGVETESSSSDDDVNIKDLRKDEKLRKMVRKELVSLGLESEDSSSDSSSSDSSESSSSDTSSVSSKANKKNKKKKKKSHKKKSGISVKSSDKVKFPQSWPHSHLQFEYVNKRVKFDDLDFKLFIAGELEIISEEGISKSERKGRLNLLKKIVYYSSTYDFKGLKSFYAAWLREIELGKKSWSEDSQQIESAILTKHIRSQKTQFSNKRDFYDKKDYSDKKTQSSEEKVWFCSAYQRNKCSFRADHMVVIKGKMRLATHICASCWQKDKKKLQHPESSFGCPYASA